MRRPPSTAETGPSFQDVLQAEATTAAAEAVRGALKRVKAARPDLLPRGLPPDMVEKITSDAVTAWILARHKQAKRLGVAPTFMDAWITGQAWPEPADFL